MSSQLRWVATGASNPPPGLGPARPFAPATYFLVFVNSMTGKFIFATSN